MVPLFLTVFIDLVGLGIAIPALSIVFLDPNLSIFPASVPPEIRKILYGFLIAVFPLAQFFGAPLLGALSDQRGRKPILILSLCGTVIGYILFALGIVYRNIPLLFLSRALDGFTGGNISIAIASIADISDEKSRSRNFGLIGMAFGLGFILGPYLGGKLADPMVLPWFNLATPFWFAALLTSVNILLFFWIFNETLAKKINTPVSLLTGFRNIHRAFDLKHMRTILLVIFLLTLGFNFFTQFFNVYLIERFHFNQVNIGELFGFVGICIAIVQGLVLRPLSARFSPELILSYSIFGLAIVLPLLVVPDTPFGMYLLMPFIALFQGLTEPTSTAVVSNMTGKESQGEIMGIKQSIQSLAQAIPPLIAGFISIIGSNLPMFLASIVTFVAWGLFYAVFRHKPREVFHEVG